MKHKIGFWLIPKQKEIIFSHVEYIIKIYSGKDIVNKKPVYEVKGILDSTWCIHGPELSTNSDFTIILNVNYVRSGKKITGYLAGHYTVDRFKKGYPKIEISFPLTFGNTKKPARNTKQENISKENIELYFMCYCAEADRAFQLFDVAAKTRHYIIDNKYAYNSKKYLVKTIKFLSVDEIPDEINSYFDKIKLKKPNISVREISIFSHSGGDGPLTYRKKVKKFVLDKDAQQMTPEGWNQINVTWAQGISRFCIFGCNSASNDKSKNNFARNISQLSSFQNIEIWGQPYESTSSQFPSFRIISAADLLIHSIPIYMVSTQKGISGRDSLSVVPNLNTSDKNLSAANYYRCAPMSCYVNGVGKKHTYQSEFNDHRRVKIW